MTLQQDLSIFDVDSVQQCFSADNPKMASPVDLANGVSLFIAIPDHLLKSYSPVFRLITQLCLNYMMSLPEWTRQNKKPVWFLIDEAGSIGAIPDMIEALARGRSKKNPDHIDLSELRPNGADLWKRRCCHYHRLRQDNDCVKLL